MVAFDDEQFTLEISTVDEYLFEDSGECVVSLSDVPVLFEDTCIPDASNVKVFLRGVTDGGLQPVYLEVVCWKLVSGYYQAKIMVLTKEGKWITLLKPKKVYLLEERSTMITIELLHFLLKKPNSSEQSLWDHLRKLFSKLPGAPSKEDIKDHLLLKLFIQRNETLATSPVLHDLLNEKSRNSSITGELKGRIVAGDGDDDEGDRSKDGDDSQSGSLQDSDPFCAICDDGGDLVCCEGVCFRSFHATKATGELSNCKSLGLTDEDVKAKFICKNCMYEQHQCFVCGKLGSSNKEKGAEVYACDSRICGHFYHPKCIASYVYWDNKADAFDYEKMIEKGKPFVCPLHRCATCKKVENKKVKGFQLAICRRCPIAYHKICIPRKIIVEDKTTTKRIWDDPKFDRILLYCLKHAVDKHTGTPAGDHIVFPDDFEKGTVASVQKMTETGEKKKRKITFSKDFRDPKRSCKRILDGPDKKKTAVVQNNMIKTEVKKNTHLASGDSHADGTPAKPVMIGVKHTPVAGAENDHVEEEAPALSKKQNRKALGSPCSHAKTGKRHKTPVKKFNLNSRSIMQSLISRPIYKTDKHNKVAHKPSISLEDMNRNLMMPPTNGRETGKNVKQAKVMRTDSQVIDGNLADEQADNCLKNAEVTNIQVFNSEKRDRVIVSEKQKFGSFDESSSLFPSLSSILEQFAKPWSDVEASADDMHASGMHPCLRDFALGPNKSARLHHTSCGWLDD